MYCTNCGNEVSTKAAICIKCGVPTGVNSVGSSNKSRSAYVLLGIFLGTLGIHNFYAGYTGKGIMQLLITLLTGWLIIPLIAVWIWVLVEICTVNKDVKGNIFT